MLVEMQSGRMRKCYKVIEGWLLIKEQTRCSGKSHWPALLVANVAAVLESC